MSTVAQFKAACLSRFRAEAGLSGVQIAWGNPYPARASDELIIIGDARGRQRPTGLGTTAQEVEYHTPVLISVAGHSSRSQQAQEERAWALFAVIQDSITRWRTEATPFGGVVSWALVSEWTTAEALSGDVREASITVTISVEARI